MGFLRRRQRKTLVASLLFEREVSRKFREHNPPVKLFREIDILSLERANSYYCLREEEKITSLSNGKEREKEKEKRSEKGGKGRFIF